MTQEKTAHDTDMPAQNQQTEEEEEANKACHTTATSPLVGGVVRGFMASPPFPRLPSLASVYAL
jgi:hypothetical protein